MARKLFRPQFSLRVLFVVTFLLGPVLGTFVYRVRQRPLDARRTIDQLQSKGIAIQFKLQDSADADIASKFFGASPMPIKCDVAYVDNSTFSDDDLALFGLLPDFDVLRLHGTRISDRGLLHLRHLRRIRFLTLDETCISDEGLAHLAAISEISELWLSGTAVTDRGAAELAHRTDVKYLNLRKTKITDLGLAELGKMKQLVDLNVSDCEVTDSGIGNLVGLTNLEQLDLSGTGLTDEGLVHFHSMKKLSVLDVRNSAVTAAAALRLSQGRLENPIAVFGAGE